MGRHGSLRMKTNRYKEVKESEPGGDFENSKIFRKLNSEKGSRKKLMMSYLTQHKAQRHEYRIGRWNFTMPQRSRRADSWYPGFWHRTLAADWDRANYVGGHSPNQRSLLAFAIRTAISRASHNSTQRVGNLGLARSSWVVDGDLPFVLNTLLK